MAESRPRVSLIVPAFNEHESVSEILAFYRAIRAEYVAVDFELVVVDDGSVDGTAQAVVDGLTPGDDAQVLSLSRNFGSHAAITAGISRCTGEAALTLSADRQEPLEAIGQFLDSWRKGADLVWGLRSVRATKKGPSERFATGFSRVFHATSTVPTYPPEGPSQIFLTRPVMDVLNAMPEANRNILAMAAWVGFDQRRIFFEQLPRPFGTSKWTSAKKLKLVIDSFVEFSAAPIRWVSIAGMLLGLLGLALLLVALVLLAVPGRSIEGGVALTGLVLSLGGTQLFAIGLIGEYVWRAGDDARGRPVFIIRSAHRTPVAMTVSG